jgi:hypothetical protein
MPLRKLRLMNPPRKTATRKRAGASGSKTLKKLSNGRYMYGGKFVSAAEAAKIRKRRAAAAQRKKTKRTGPAKTPGLRAAKPAKRRTRKVTSRRRGPYVRGGMSAEEWGRAIDESAKRRKRPARKKPVRKAVRKPVKRKAAKPKTRRSPVAKKRRTVKRRSTSAKRSAAAKKAARTRAANKRKRSAAAKKAAKTRRTKTTRRKATRRKATRKVTRRRSPVRRRKVTRRKGRLSKQSMRLRRKRRGPYRRAKLSRTTGKRGGYRYNVSWMRRNPFGALKQAFKDTLPIFAGMAVTRVVSKLLNDQVLSKVTALNTGTMAKIKPFVTPLAMTVLSCVVLPKVKAVKATWLKPLQIAAAMSVMDVAAREVVKAIGTSAGTAAPYLNAAAGMGEYLPMGDYMSDPTGYALPAAHTGAISDFAVSEHLAEYAPEAMGLDAAEVLAGDELGYLNEGGAGGSLRGTVFGS